MAPLIEDMQASLAGAVPAERLEHIASTLFHLAYESGYRGNLWHCALAEALVVDENAYSLTAERRGKADGGLREAAKADLDCFYRLFQRDVRALYAEAGLEFGEQIADYRGALKGGRRYNAYITEAINQLAADLSGAGNVEELQESLEAFYGKYGVGNLGLHKAFRLENKHPEPSPINNILVTSLEDLVGYEEQKRQLKENTEAFIAGRPANNCLLYGEAGTGKSSSIRAILNAYASRGLRMIEVYKHQYQEISALIQRIKDRNYKFVIYLDDLSFEEFEVEYKYLKAVIEGGLESKPSNVVIYATSNRRHLVRERFDDRPESPLDKHKNETVQEKLSLFARFGTTIYYGAPAQKEFHHIVKTLAKRYGIDMPEEELLLEAGRFELSHNGLSGRTASQFIDHLRGNYGNQE